MDSPSSTDLPRRPFILLAASTLALTALADLLLFGHRPGLGLALYLPAVWAALALHRSPSAAGPKDYLLIGLLVATATASAVAPSAANYLVLMLITFHASGHWLDQRLSPFWARTLQGARAFLSPASLARNLGCGIGVLTTTGRHGVARGSRLLRLVRIIVPVLVVALPFVILLGSGNAILGQAIADGIAGLVAALADLRLPSSLRVFFWAVVAGSIFALLGNPAPRMAHIDVARAGERPAPADPSIAIWRTRLLLLAVNGLFFAANATDLVFLWGGGAELPRDVTYSAFVHEGVNNLIASVVLAAAVLLLVFRQARQVTEARGLRPLACLWIVQNLMLVGGAVLRLKLYVDAYGLSVLRVHVVMFLALVTVGFLLLAIRIVQRRSFLWLAGGNLLASFALFFIAQFLDVRGMVASENVSAVLQGGRRAADLDIGYLIRLAPESWPALRTVAGNPDRFGEHSLQAARFLGRERERQVALAAGEDWRSWSLRLARLRRAAFPDFEAAVAARMAKRGEAPPRKPDTRRLARR